MSEMKTIEQRCPKCGADTSHLYGRGPCPECLRKEALSSNPRGGLLWALAEIERLTRELQGTKDELYSVDKVAKELGAERDRLWAALERIANEACADESAGWRHIVRVYQSIAREALAGVQNHPESSPASGQSHTVVNAALNIGQEIGHTKRSTDETTGDYGANEMARRFLTDDSK